MSAGRALSGEQAAALTAGLPLIWNAGLAWLRLVQLCHIVEGHPRGADGRISHSSVQAERAFGELGLLRVATWKTQTVSRGRTWPVRARPVIACPACGEIAWRLLARDAAWHCRQCYEPPGHLDGWGKPHTTLSRTEILLGDYACGVRIGLTGCHMVRRRRRLLERLRTRHLLKGRSAEDLVLLAMAGPLLRVVPHFQRTGNRPIVLGAIWTRLQPHLVPLAIEHLLHPQAYLARFGGTTWR